MAWTITQQVSYSCMFFYSCLYPPFITPSQLKLRLVKLKSSFSLHSFKVRWFRFSPLPLIPLTEPHSGHFNKHWTDMSPQKICKQHILHWSELCHVMFVKIMISNIQLYQMHSQSRMTWANLGCNFSSSVILMRKGYQDSKEKCRSDLERSSLYLTLSKFIHHQTPTLVRPE